MIKKLLLALCLAGLAAATAHASLLLQDSLNYPYTNGCIEGQGQWFCYYPSPTTNFDAGVTNNALFLCTNHVDSVATPTNGFYNSTNGTVTFATFTVDVTQLPATTNGTYFADLRATNGDHVCNLFIDTEAAVTPGTYRLGIANFATDFTAPGTANYPQDLATNTTYTVVMSYDTAKNSAIVGATLWINPSATDLQNAYSGNEGSGYVFGSDTTTVTNLLSIQIAQIAFGPYGGNESISNVLIGSTYQDVLTTNLPVIGLEPAPATNYSGNSCEFYTAASGVDLTYQWYFNGMPLTDDGVNTLGSQTPTLTVNNLTGANNGYYYVTVTDTYGKTATSSNAVSTVITTPTPPFFPTNVVAESLTNNIFTATGFTNAALGTGPLYYQWFFQPTTTNTPAGETTNNYYPVSGANSSSLVFFIADLTYVGNYYVVVSNSINGGSVAVGPTNTLQELPPVVATLAQLHQYEVNTVASLGINALLSHMVYVNKNNVSVSGYVTTYGGFGSGTYTEYNIQDANGYGAEVYLSDTASGTSSGYGNTFTPPVGSYVTITAPVEIYNTELELAPSSLSSIVVSNPPTPFVVGPVLENANFNTLSTNALGTNALNLNMALVTFTNCYIYGSSTGGAIGTGGSHSGVSGVFLANSYDILYFTVGAPYSATNKNTIEIYQFGYNYPQATNVNNSTFYNQTIPTHCAQLTGAYVDYNGGPEIEPARLADYVINPPAAFSTTISNSVKTVKLTWPVQFGSTYSVIGATNLLGPWTNLAFGLGYYPTNGSFTMSNTNQAMFFQISSP